MSRHQMLGPWLAVEPARLTIEDMKDANTNERRITVRRAGNERRRDERRADRRQRWTGGGQAGERLEEHRRTRLRRLTHRRSVAERRVEPPPATS